MEEPRGHETWTWTIRGQIPPGLSKPAPSKRVNSSDGCFRARHSKMQVPLPVLKCFGDMNPQQEDEKQVNFGYQALIKRLIKPRWEHSAQWEGGGEDCWLVLQAVHQLYPLSAGLVVPESSPGLLGPLISSQGINQVFMGLVECTAAQTDY